MTHREAMHAIRQAVNTAELSQIIDDYLESLGEDPEDTASETYEETAERFHDEGNTAAYNVLIVAHNRWYELEGLDDDDTQTE